MPTEIKPIEFPEYQKACIDFWNAEVLLNEAIIKNMDDAVQNERYDAREKAFKVLDDIIFNLHNDRLIAMPYNPEEAKKCD